MENQFKILGVGSLYVLLGMVAYKIGFLGSQVLLGRFLGPGGYGTLSIGISFLVITAIIVRMGLETGLRKFIPRSNNKESAWLIKYSSRMVLTSSFLVSFLVFVLSDKISVLFNNPSLAFVLKVFAIILPFNALEIIFLRSIEGFLEFKYRFWIEGLFFGGLLFASVLTALLVGSLLEVCVAFLLTYALTCLMSFIVLNKRVNFLPAKRQGFIGEKMFEYSWPITFHSTLEIGMRHFNVLIIGLLLSEESVGLYSAALNVSLLVLSLLVVVTPVFFPIVSKIKSKETSFSFYSKITKWISIASLPVVLGFALFSKQILLLFGPEFVQARPVMLILLLGCSVEVISGPIENLLNALGRTRFVMAIMTISSALGIALAFYTIPLYGVVGAAWAYSAAIAFQKASCYIGLRVSN